MESDTSYQQQVTDRDTSRTEMAILDPQAQQNYYQQQQQQMPPPQQQPYPPQQPGQYPPGQCPPPMAGQQCPPGQYPPQQPGQYPPGQYPPQQPGQYPPGQYPPQQPGQYPPGQYPPHNPYDQPTPQPMGNQVLQPVDMQPAKQKDDKKNPGLKLLKDLPAIFIKEKVDILEAVSGFERENKYKVYPADEKGKKCSKHEIFEIKEKSNCLQRQCCPGDMRAFNLKIKAVVQEKDSSNFKEKKVFKAERDFKCTCCCLARPELEMFDDYGENDIQIGKIINPCTCCTIQMNIFDKAENLRYQMYGNGCQQGYMCRCCPCDPCQEMDFEIQDANGSFLSQMKKKANGCFKAALTDADNYSVVFPKDATPEDKALMMASVILIDYQHFEQSPADRSEGGVHID